MASTIALRRFIDRENLRMSCEWADRNPHMADDDWSRSASHYRCTIRQGRKSMVTYFSMGPAHTTEPELRDVLDCLASDAAGYENARSFGEWAEEYGYDPDSRKAERTYRTIARQATRLRAFLGDSAYDTLLWHTERL